jgi:hypothetical protein
MAGRLRSVEWSVRVYGALIKAYPASFRREYASEMILVFREHLMDTRRKRGAVGLLTAWFRVLGDLAWTVPEQHFHEIQRRIEMRSVALALLSAVLAAVVYFAISFGGMIGMLWLMLDMDGPGGLILPIVLAVWYLSAFLTGLLLTRVKPFFAPVATAPLATMAITSIWGPGLFFNGATHALGWRAWLLYVGFATSMGLASLLGCLVATKAANRLARFSVPWFQLVGPLAVLICTSLVACVLRMMLMFDQISSDLQRALAFCLFALLVIGAVTIANIVLLFVRSYKKAAAQ